MKKLTLILLFIGSVFLYSCSTITYYANGKSGMPCPDIPVIEPYTDIASFKTRYFEREHDDSLTTRAHEVMMDILQEKGETWHLGDVLELSDSSEYEAIRKDIYDLLDSFGKKKNHDEARIWPTDKKKMANASLPPSLLEYMKRNDKPYVMILLQNGFEYIKDENAGIRAYRKKGYEIENISDGDYYSELDCFVADALQNRIYFYSGQGGLKPTDKVVVEVGMDYLMSDYIRKNSIISKGLPKTYLSLFAGYGQVYPSAFGTDGRDVGPTNISWGLDMMWSISNTPLSLGLSAIVNEHVITQVNERVVKRNTHLTRVYSPMIGWNRIVANRHLFGLGLGVGLARSSVSGETKRYYLAENAVLSYGYRVDNNRVIGLKAHAYTFNDRFAKNELLKPIIPMWSVSLCYTFMGF